MALIGNLLILLLQIYSFVIILEVLLSWLIVFKVIDVRNDQAKNLIALLHRATSPVYQRLRMIIPPIAGIDIAPLVVLFGIYFLEMLVAQIFFM